MQFWSPKFQTVLSTLPLKHASMHANAPLISRQRTGKALHCIILQSAAIQADVQTPFVALC